MLELFFVTKAYHECRRIGEQEQRTMDGIDGYVQFMLTGCLLT